MDDVDDPVGIAERRLAGVVAALERDLGAIRVGAASGALIEGIHVEHGGRRLRLIELASVSIPDPRQIVIRPWDPTSLRAIGTAISRSRVGLTPTIDGGVIRIAVPAMTGERRNELIRLVHERAERAHVDVRRVRHDALARLREGGRAHHGGSDDARRAMDRLERSAATTATTIDRLAAARTATIERV